MAATAHSWIPAHGRHRVDIGSSLGRALKARKGTTTAKRTNLPNRDLYSFRYNFKPPSIDPTKPSTINVKRGKDATSVTVEHMSHQDGEGHLFVGSEQEAKDVDCVLIYDEETDAFTLEKLDSYMVLTYERKTVSATQSTASPLPSQSVASSSSRELTRDLDFEAQQLEKDLLGVEEDADGEPDDDLEEISPLSTTARKQEEEEEEEEEEEIVVVPAPPPPPRLPTKSKSRRSSKPNPARRESNAPPPATKSKPPNKAKGKAKREAPVSDFEEEDLEFGQPSRKTKRARPHQVPPPSEGLALPGSSSTFHPSAAPYSSSLPSSNNKASAHVPPPPHPIVTASDSEEDWEPVPANHTLDPFAKNDDGDIEEGEEIDVSEFEAVMNEELGDSDDFLAGAVSPEPESALLTGRPMSLNQFARGGEASQDDDDYSTSEESDDD